MQDNEEINSFVEEPLESEGEARNMKNYEGAVKSLPSCKPVSGGGALHAKIAGGFELGTQVKGYKEF